LHQLRVEAGEDDKAVYEFGVAQLATTQDDMLGIKRGLYVRGTTRGEEGEMGIYENGGLAASAAND